MMMMRMMMDNISKQSSVANVAASYVQSRRARPVVRAWLPLDGPINPGGTAGRGRLAGATLRLIPALASYLGWSLWQMGVCNAPLPAADDPPVYMHTPNCKGYGRAGKILRLRVLVGAACCNRALAIGRWCC